MQRMNVIRERSYPLKFDSESDTDIDYRKKKIEHTKGIRDERKNIEALVTILTLIQPTGRKKHNIDKIPVQSSRHNFQEEKPRKYK